MRPANRITHILIWSLIIANPLFASVKLQVREGHPVVDGVYVNGHGPYRFLIDTGSNVNLIDAALARKIGMNATFQVDLASAAGKAAAPGSDGNEILLDSAEAGSQKFLLSRLEAIHRSSPDIQGVLGEWFLSQFDYTLDLRGKQLEFGRQSRSGTRSPFTTVNARPIVSTSLGHLALDSGQAQLVLFGVQPDSRPDLRSEMRTLAGSVQVGIVSAKRLIIEGKRFSSGDAVAIPNRPETDVDGLMPLTPFKTVYVCNSEGYIVFE